jgi:release factor glutamine methyltransferase
MTAPRELIATATAHLAAAGIESARVDAELLLAHCLGRERAQLALVERVPAATAAAFDALVTRRAAREPLQHIVGTAPFRHIRVEVGPGVFIPRPETELLVDAVLPILRAADAPIAVDLCAGSGALALAIADEVPDARVYAVEQSVEALPWLRRNATGTSIEVVAADVTDSALLEPLRGTVHAVVSNPPYVPDPTWIAPEVAADPRAAVFAGPDGLAVIPHAIARAAELLHAGGILAIEHDDTHADAVPALLARDGRWHGVSDHRDLTGRARFAVATRD